jgi:energy-coupling factor transporter ATP-binding protein EcfA2
MVRRGMAHVPEGRGVIAELTVEENLRLGGLFTKESGADDVEEVYRLFPSLDSRRKRSAHTLSGGERQMLVVGRALLSKPKVLLLDEPSLGLAPLVVAQIFALVRDLVDRTGLAVLLVEQNAKSALSIADRGVVLSLGRVVAAAGAATLAVAGLAVAVELARPPESRTHLGRLAADTLHHGEGSLLTTVARKASVNLDNLRSVPWAWAVLIAAAVLLSLAATGRGGFTHVLPTGSGRRVGVLAALTAGLLGFAVNDSGVIVTLMVLVEVAPVLALAALAPAAGLRSVLLEPAPEPAPAPGPPARTPSPQP